MKLSGFKGLALSLLFIMASGFNAASAALITHNGYTLDTETNIVTGGGLEWLQWDVTVGQSVNTALAANGIFGGVDYGTGWELASNVQMAAAFKAFSFNSTTDGNESANTVSAYTPNVDNSRMDEFIELFGTIVQMSGGRFGTGVDEYRATGAMYGSQTNVDGWHNYAWVASDFVDNFPESSEKDATAFTERWFLDSNYAAEQFGVALVRQIEVPEPSTVAILALGLLGLGLRSSVRV